MAVLDYYRRMDNAVASCSRYSSDLVLHSMKYRICTVVITHEYVFKEDRVSRFYSNVAVL